ncbi:unnamed protein product [Phytophthora fragariaefolia]|uniref:Unnamed protein product n=1 Tax=Phytophthora fragariaefolia TaxID=1490495 RepID=A0A9W7D0S9_9STRA|nr:unnamed protein product [Phytophthora fragariaefolia]
MLHRLPSKQSVKKIERDRGVIRVGMSDNELPPRAQELIKCFVNFPDRVRYYLDATEREGFEFSEYVPWISQLCAPAYEEVVALIEDPENAYIHPSFIRLLFRDNTYKDLRNRNIRLVDALAAGSSRQVLEEFFKYLPELSAEDRARSFLLLASEIPSSGIYQDENDDRIEWQNTIVASFTTSPRIFRPQLLLASSIIGHKPMVTLLLGDIATDDDPAPNIDAVEAECLIEAATNQHFQIVQGLLAGGRFSNGNETRWDAVVQSLEMSCTNGSADITDILLPHYLSYCSVISSCGVHHPRLLRLALSNWHFEIVEMLLECDPRGTICNMMELIDTLREEVSQSAQGPAAPSEMLSIVIGEENDEMGDLVLWDAAALARGVSSKNKTLVKFLVSHVEFCSEALQAAMETAQNIGNEELVDIISAGLQKVTDQYAELEDAEHKSTDSSFSPFSSSVVSVNDDWDAGEQLLFDSIDEHDTRLIRTIDGVESPTCSVKPQDVDRLQSTIDFVALRTASFEEVKRMIHTAIQYVVLKKTKTTQENFPSYYAEVEDGETGNSKDAVLDHSVKVGKRAIQDYTYERFTDDDKVEPEEIIHDSMFRHVEIQDNLSDNDAESDEVKTESHHNYELDDFSCLQQVKMDKDPLLSHPREFEGGMLKTIQNDTSDRSAKFQTDAALVTEYNTLTDLEQCNDTHTAATQLLVLQFSSNTVNQMLCDGKLAAVQHAVKNQTQGAVLEPSEAILLSNGSAHQSVIKSEFADCGPCSDVAVVEVLKVEIFKNISYVDENTPGIPARGVEPLAEDVPVQGDDNSIRDVVPCESFSETLIEGTFSPQTMDFVLDDGLKSVQEGVGSADANLEVKNCAEVASQDRQVAETLSTSVLQCSVGSAPVNGFGSAGDNTDNSVMVNLTSGTSVRVDYSPEINSDNGSNTTIYTAQARLLQPQPTDSLARSPSISPTRSTIICPVKWIEHAIDTSEASILKAASSAPLHEGDRVEVHYKGRSVLLPGVVSFCHPSGVYDVIYEDGEEETCVSRDFIHLIESPQDATGLTVQSETEGDNDTTLCAGISGPFQPTQMSYESYLNGTSRHKYDGTSNDTTFLANNILLQKPDQLGSGDNNNDRDERGEADISAVSDSTRNSRGIQSKGGLPSFNLNLLGDNNTVGRGLSSERKGKTHVNCVSPSCKSASSMKQSADAFILL